MIRDVGLQPRRHPKHHMSRDKIANEEVPRDGVFQVLASLQACRNGIFGMDTGLKQRPSSSATGLLGSSVSCISYILTVCAAADLLS